MNITYRTKQKFGKGHHGTSIQVKFDKKELPAVQKLADELEPLGLEYRKSPFPEMMQSGHQANFYKKGSLMFGLQTDVEHKKLISESLPILKKFDANVTDKILLYDID